eukprot:m.270911 g.270911  ORF g.270911 m.270911 type:complete len:146 (-) comp15682_c0_seq31:2617-3054(-)
MSSGHGRPPPKKVVNGEEEEEEEEDMYEIVVEKSGCKEEHFALLVSSFTSHTTNRMHNVCRRALYTFVVCQTNTLCSLSDQRPTRLSSMLEASAFSCVEDFYFVRDFHWVQDCMDERNRDWRLCQDYVKALRDCVASQQQKKQPK